MPRLESWRWDGTSGIADVGGMRLWVRCGDNPTTWGIRSAQGDVAGGEVETIIDVGDAWRSARDAAQDAVEAEAARLLAEDAGVRALLPAEETGCPACSGTGWGHPDFEGDYDTDAEAHGRFRAPTDTEWDAIRAGVSRWADWEWEGVDDE